MVFQSDKVALLVNRLRLALAIAVLALAGCQTVKFQTGRAAAPTHVEQDIHFWLWGLVGDPVVDLDAACPGGVATFRVDARLGDYLVDVITLGIYAPRTVSIQCVEVKR
jgi:hypothetical protein